MSTFAVLAAEDFESKQARSRAITAAIVRAQEMFDPYLSRASSAEDKADRILLIEDDLKRIAYAVSKEYGYEDYRHLYAAARHVLAEDKEEDDCDEDDKDKAEAEDKDGDKKEWQKPWEKDSTSKMAKTCPECEEGTMRKDDHVWICPNCDYETSEPDDDDGDDDGDDEKRSSTRSAAGPAPDAGDSYDWKREDLPSNKDTGLGGPSPKIDKGSAGDVASNSQKPIDIGSKKHQHELQNATDRADYNDSDFDPSNPVRERVDADKAMQPEHPVAPHTDTWHGTDGQAKPVTSAVIARYRLVELT